MIEEAFRTLHNASVLAAYVAWSSGDREVLEAAIQQAQMGLAELIAYRDGPGEFTERASGVVVPDEKVDIPDVFKSAFDAG